MSEVAIRVDSLSKRYRIGQREPYKTLYHTLARVGSWPVKAVQRVMRGQNPLSAALRRSNGNPNEEDKRHIWALKNISFEVKRGEVIGIIGRNGSGKSTLLKILSQITEPTEGYAELYGRVGSLLEVGTGFHPELTGRENIYLSGAILGMKKVEIDRKFDEIVAFAEIETFIDTPVKYYSSGMHVRLGFAVAAHLEPEILLVDEVLAVGDAAFQKKCLGKMGDVAKEGRTVLFVSHNMGAIRELAFRGIGLNEGKILYDGDAQEAISKYLSFGQAMEHATVHLSHHPNRLPRMKTILQRVTCKSPNDHLPCRDFTQNEDIVLEIEYSAPDDSINLAGAGFIIRTADGVRVGGFNTYMTYGAPHKIPRTGKVLFTIPARQFTPGKYLVTVSLGSHQGVLEDKVEDSISFTVHPADIYGTGYLLTREDGVMALNVRVFMEDQ